MSMPLVQRGPDGEGYFLQNALGLAHRRLSVIDLHTGDQPMFNEDKSLVLVFNGEIYDYRILRHELVAKGHTFRTESDSEVLLHLFEEEGEQMCRRLNGMFAFVIANLKTNELFLARDRLGQKPMFYATSGKRLAFASGPSSLRALPWIDTSIDPASLHNYLEFLYVPEPHSIHRGISKLPPGSWARFKDGEWTQHKYWQPEMSGDYDGSYSDAKAMLRDQLSAAVNRRLVADVPLGMFLSGGMDSSIICALAQQQLGESSPRTFAIGFTDPKYDEREHAAAVAKHLGTNHHFLEVNPGDFSHLEWTVKQYEEPFADSSMLPTTLLSKFTREHVTVALSGDAADELFGGYYRYRVYKLLEFLRVCPRAMRSVVRTMLLKLLPPMTEERSLAGKIRRLVDLGDVDGLERYLRIISRFPESNRRAIYGDQMKSAELQPSIGVLQNKLDGGANINRITELELKTYLVDDILTKVDRASMAHSLEVRSPFLDPGVVDLALSLPYRYKQHGAERKRILKDAFQDLLPADIFARRKMGFGVPIASWLRGDWRKPATELLLDGQAVAKGWLDRPALESFLNTHLNEQADHSYPLFALIVFELWLRNS